MQLQARIIVMTSLNDSPFYYTTDYKEFENIINFSSNSIGKWEIEKGKEININGKKYSIESFEVHLHPKLYEPNGPGINMFGIGNEYAFNVDIALIVK